MRATSSLERDWLRGFAPPPRLTPSGWAERYRRLPEASAARGARWRNATCAYLPEIMDSLVAPETRQVALVKAAQVGASEACTCVLGYVMHYAGRPVLFVGPTASGVTSFSKERLADMLRSTPELASIVSDKRGAPDDGLPESTLSLKMYPGGFLALVGANTPNSFSRWSTWLVIADDADRIPRSVGAEGDPTKLLINRTTSFHDGRAVFLSTPVLAGGRIETLFGQGDQRRYVLGCPGCGREDWVTWSDPSHWWVRFDERRPETARLQCPCGHAVGEPERMALVRQGHWRATAAPLAPGFVSFHLPAMLSPFITLAGLTTKFLAALGGSPRRLMEFRTTQLAEGWRDEATAVEPDVLVARMEDF
jgi:phage terminase large subunit GpA-like protein